MSKSAEWTEEDLPLLLWGFLPMVIILIISFPIGSLVNISLVEPVTCGCLLAYIAVACIIDIMKGVNEDDNGA